MGESKRRKQLDPTWGRVEKRNRKEANGFVAKYPIEEEFLIIIHLFADMILQAHEPTTKGATVAEYHPNEMKFFFASEAELVSSCEKDDFILTLLDRIHTHELSEEIVFGYIFRDNESFSAVLNKAQLQEWIQELNCASSGNCSKKTSSSSIKVLE